MTEPTVYTSEHPAGRPAADDDLRQVLDPELYALYQATKDDEETD